MTTPEAEPFKITAYKHPNRPFYPIVPAAKLRDWIDKTPHKFGYLCLPLLIANQTGWFILSPARVIAHWNGNNDRNAINIAV